MIRELYITIIVIFVNFRILVIGLIAKLFVKRNLQIFSNRFKREAVS